MDLRHDITARKHKGSPTSVAANPTRSTKEVDCDRILRFISRVGKSHLKEIVRELQIPIQTASARLADLKEAKRIEVVAGERREGCGIVQIKKEFVGGLF